MKIFYTYSAVQDLQRLHDFIAKESSKAASEVSTKLRQAIKRLLEFPMLGREVKSTDKSVSLRDLVTGKYVIRYALLEREILVLRIWHSKEDR